MKKVTKNIGIYVIIFGLVLAMVWFYNSDAPKEEKEIKTSTMIHYLQDKKVESINVTETKMTAELNNGKTVYAYVNSAVDLSYIYDSYIMPQVDEGSLKLNSDEPKKESIWISLLPTLIMIGIMVVFFILIMNQSGGGGKAMSFGKSRAKLQKDSDLKGQMASEGTTPRRLTDLIGSLCDLTSGSGDKGTPIIVVQNYFKNYAE